MREKISNYLYKLYLFLAGRKKELEFFHVLKRTEKAPASTLIKIQAELLSQLIKHAYGQVPYYKKIISQVSGWDVLVNSEPMTLLSKLPLLTKDIIRKYRDELKSNDLSLRRWYYNASGGSTGEPVEFIQDWIYHQQSQAVSRLFDSWTGYTAGMSKVLLWGSESDLLGRKVTFKTRLGRWLRNEHWLNTFKMTDAEMRNYIEIINKIRPTQILAYVESIYELCRFAQNNKITVNPPKAVMTSAGTLYLHFRNAIEKIFKTQIFNLYGSREVGGIACECEAHTGLHVSPLTNYVEIIRSDGFPVYPGEMGEVVITSLINYAMPFIRYRIGDFAVWSEELCSCGREWPLLKQVWGRVTSVFTRRDGTKIIPEYFIHVIGVVLKPSWLKKFQVIQEDYDLIRFIFVPSISFEKANKYIEKQRAELEKMVRLVMGNDSHLEIELVSDIAPLASGKYMYSICKVSENE